VLSDTAENVSAYTPILVV